MSEAAKRATRKYRNSAKYRATQLAYQTSLNGKAVSNRAQSRYDAAHPEIRVARYIANNALRAGQLIRKPCEICGSTKTEGHHDDYSKPLEIRWLCKQHHTEKHRKE
jgi:hypothetical protein